MTSVYKSLLITVINVSSVITRISPIYQVTDILYFTILYSLCLYVDSFEEILTIGKKLCLYNAHFEHELKVEQCGLRLVIPAEVITITLTESLYEVAVQGLWSAGKFEIS